MNRKFYELALKYFASEENGGIDAWSDEQERAGEFLNDMADHIMARRKLIDRVIEETAREHAEKS